MSNAFFSRPAGKTFRGLAFIGVLFGIAMSNTAAQEVASRHIADQFTRADLWPILDHALANRQLTQPQIIGWAIEEAATEQAVTESLEKRARFDWYEDGELRPIKLSKEGDLRQPSFEWRWPDWSSRNNQPNNTTNSDLPNADFGWFSDAMRSFVWILLAVAIALLLYFWLTRIARQKMNLGSSDPNQHLPRQEADLIEHLPFQVTAPKTDLLAEARRHFEAGDFNQAIVYLYSHQLIQLDRHEKIRLNKGKTNRQYLLELRRETPLSRILSRTVLAFEDAFFGHHQLDENRFNVCWSELEKFTSLLAQPPTTR